MRKVSVVTVMIEVMRLMKKENASIRDLGLELVLGFGLEDSDWVRNEND